MVDCSHANSSKQHERQLDVARDIARQIAGGSRSVFGVMMEATCTPARRSSRRARTTLRAGIRQEHHRCLPGLGRFRGLPGRNWRPPCRRGAVRCKLHWHHHGPISRKTGMHAQRSIGGPRARTGIPAWYRRPSPQQRQARRWLDDEFTRLDCEPLRASGKVLLADKVLTVAPGRGCAAGRPRWGQPVCRRRRGADPSRGAGGRGAMASRSEL